MKNKMFNVLIISLTLISVYWILIFFFNWGGQISKNDKISDGRRQEQMLSTCVLEAEQRYQSVRSYNSEFVREGVIRWKSSYLAEEAQKALENEKDFCLTKFKIGMGY